MINVTTTIFQGDVPPNLARTLCQTSAIACDIETSGLDWRKESIGTFQLYAPDLGTAIVKCSPNLVPVGLQAILESPNVAKIFHHASFDLSFLRSQWGIRGSFIVCTKIASKIFNPTAPKEQHSLKYLLQQYLGISISKEQQQSDWLAPELSRNQLDYAAEDVRHLLDLRRVLEDGIENQKLGPLYEECLRFLPSHVELEVGNWPDVFKY